MPVALITGCSSGFGLAFAAAFARHGHQVIATMRDLGRGDGLRRTVEAERLAGIDIRELDVTRSETFDPLLGAVIRDYGRIDVLVNNAGIAAIGALEVLDAGVWRDVFETNFFGAIALTRAVLPHMRRQHSGRIIFMSAIGALLNTAYFGPYGVSKAAITGLAATLDTEVRPFGIRVSAILPSAYHTAIAGNMTLHPGEDSPYEKATRGYHAGLTKRITEGPADLAPVVEAVLDAAMSPEPRHLYLVAPHLAGVLQPVVDSLEALHQREVELTRPLQD
jgi:NAD(P)-dependent dehydrogenase (short-subunit alcohol dehydrogenase family)